MRLRNIRGSREAIAENEYTVKSPESLKGRWNECFGNDALLRLEIGCGKGRFIKELAKRERNVNFVGIEKYSSVLIRALEKLDEEDTNLRFIRMDAEVICDCFGENESDRIYLNFSDPWPKERHAKRRLESRQFLERYRGILKKDGLIEFKTDNTGLFEFALEEAEFMKEYYEMVECTRDLHNDARLMEGNVMTEYEERFSAMGNPICKYILRRL